MASSVLQSLLLLRGVDVSQSDIERLVVRQEGQRICVRNPDYLM
jgi:hypothetical protein